MFELPDAKRVRRSELLRSPSSSPAPPLADIQQEQYSKQLHLDLEFIDIGSQPQSLNGPLPQPAQPRAAAPSPLAAAPSPLEAANNGSDAFEFRLFSTRRRADRSSHASPGQSTPTSRTKELAGIQRISIRSPTPQLTGAAGDDGGGFVVPYRPQHYYFTNAADVERKKATYADVAVSSGQVRERARKTRWPGTALPWRVIHLSAMGSSSSIRVHTLPPFTPATTTKTRRTRAGKKRRLAIRKKYAATASRAETEREKRTRRNREKKVKKKEREKKKKEILKADEAMDQNE